MHTEIRPGGRRCWRNWPGFRPGAEHKDRVVPAEAGTHNPRPFNRTKMVETACRITNDGGYGSPPSRGRREYYIGSAMEYFTWLSAKLDSIEAMPSSRVSLFFKNAS